MAEDMLVMMRGGRGLATRGGRGGRGGRSSALHATPGPRRPKYSIDEAWDAEDDEQQAADQTVVSEVHKQHRKSAVRQARAAACGDVHAFKFTTLPQVLLADIGLACMQASPDRAHGARVQIVARLEENRRKN